MQKALGRQKVGALSPATARLENFEIRVTPTRTAVDACVLVGVRARLSPTLLRSLSRAEACGNTDHFDETLTAFSVFAVLRKSLDAATEPFAKSPASAATCGTHNGRFLISVTCPPTIAACIRAARTVVRAFARKEAVFAEYSAWCAVFGAAPSEESFGAALAGLYAAIRARVACAFTGKVEASPSEAADAAADLVKAYKKARFSVAGPRVSRVVRPVHLPGCPRTPVDGEGGVLAPAKGLAAVALYEFVDRFSVGPPPAYTGEGVRVPATVKPRFGTQEARAAADAFLRKAEDDGYIFAYKGAKKCFLDPEEFGALEPEALRRAFTALGLPP